VGHPAEGCQSGFACVGHNGAGVGVFAAEKHMTPALAAEYEAGCPRFASFLWTLNYSGSFRRPSNSINALYRCRSQPF
jgi:hypothetical protein